MRSAPKISSRSTSCACSSKAQTRASPFSCFVVPPRRHDSFVANLHGSVTERLLSSTASQAHGSASWPGMAGACAHRPHLVEGSATALLLVSYTHMSLSRFNYWLPQRDNAPGMMEG